MNWLPIFGGGQFPAALTFIPALIVGFGFGFVLERSGFGRASVLVAQFYGHDMRVFKVMFSAIVTAMVGVAVASGAGVLDLGAVYVPETFLWAHLVGGLVLGAGFIISGYCPGTSIVGFASSKWDALLTVVGVVAGSVLFGEFYPLIKSLYLAQAKGAFTFSDLLGLRFELLAAGVTLFAIAMFVVAEKAEGFFSRRRALPAPDTLTRPAKQLLAGLAVISLGATALLLVPPSTTPVNSQISRTTPIDATTLAKKLVGAPRSITVIDLRADAKCNKHRIPMAYCLKQIASSLENLPANRPLIVYADGQTGDLPRSLARFSGRIFRLEGGFASWTALVLRKPERTISPDAYRERLALHAHFTGAKVQRPAPVLRPTVIRRKQKKGGGCL